MLLALALTKKVKERGQSEQYHSLLFSAIVKKVIGFITDGLIQCTTNGFVIIDGFGNIVGAFLDIFGVIGDTSAMNNTLHIRRDTAEDFYIHFFYEIVMRDLLNQQSIMALPCMVLKFETKGVLSLQMPCNF